jgi:hypothetical protein
MPIYQSNYASGLYNGFDSQPIEIFAKSAFIKWLGQEVLELFAQYLSIFFNSSFTCHMFDIDFY